VKSSSLGLRHLSFYLSVLGACLLGIGSVLTWGIYHPIPAWDDVIKGTDVVWGKALLALAVVALVCALLLRKGKGNESRKGFGPALLVIGLVAAVGSIAVMAAAVHLMKPTPEAIAHRVVADSPTLTYPKVLQVVIANGLSGTLNLGPGLPVVLAGGIMLAFGGSLSFMWSGSVAREDDAGSVAEDDAGSAEPADPQAG
jgi:hypothetical protein